MVTTTPAPPQALPYYDAYLKETKQIEQGAVDTVLIGDSIAQYWESRLWSPLRLANLGIGGDRTQHVLWRLGATEWSKLSTRSVLLLLGTNNLGAGDKPCAITFGLSKVINKISDIWPSAKITFLEILPRGPQFLTMNQDRIEVNIAMRAIKGINTVNVDDLITCKQTVPCANYQSDFVHLTPEGYEALMGVIKPRLF